jgi:cell division protein FtsW (lipid II flippase)
VVQGPLGKRLATHFTSIEFSEGPPHMSDLARPATVTAALWLWLVTVVFNLISAGILFVNSGSVEGADAIGAADRAATASHLVAASVTIVIAVVELIVVFQMRAGLNWARVVLAILASIQVVSTLAGTSPRSGWAGWAAAAAAAVGAVLMYLPTSNPYFRAERNRQ